MTYSGARSRATRYAVSSYNTLSDSCEDFGPSVEHGLIATNLMTAYAAWVNARVIKENLTG
jgi:hypothetical protein